MRKAKPSRIERLESQLVKVIQEKGADQNQHGGMVLLLGFLRAISCLFAAVVSLRYLLYRLGLLRRFPLGIQVISIKEAPWWQRLFTQVIEPPLVVSDGKRVLLDSAVGGDEPYMLASNLPGVAVVVDRDRVKAGRYAIKRLGCDTIILDDGFQYQRLKHSVEVVLVDSTNPFGNGHMLPRGILREPARHLKRADIIFLTKCRGDVSDVIDEIRQYNRTAEIVECNHAPKVLRDVWSREEFPLSWLEGKTTCTLSGIASPKGFENSLRHMGAKVVWCERYADHHRYDASEILYALNRTADMGADALVTTEKDAVRFPRFETSPVRCLYLRIAIEILRGKENFEQIINRICFRKR